MLFQKKIQMNNTDTIRDKVLDVISSVLNFTDNSLARSNTALHIILSESVQALEFVCLLEDEFHIEFDDDEIDLDFFSDISTIVKRIKNHLYPVVF